MRPSRRVLALSFLFILFVQVVGRDVLAATQEEVCESHGLRYNCVTEEVQVERIQPLYDNGMEGTYDLNENPKPYQSWPENWTSTGVPLRDGIKLGPLHEMKIRLLAAFDGTAQVNQTDLPYYTDTDSVRGRGVPSVRALSYVVHFNATLIMSGASEFYFKSPIVWDSDLYDKHYLNIRDATGRLVVGARYDAYAGPENVTNAILDGDRLYYHLVARLDSLVNYTVTEYVHPTDEAGLGNIDVYLANQQDTDGNGDTSFKAFPLENAQRNYDAEGDLAYHFRFVFGMGPAGTMNLLQPDPTQSETQVMIHTGAFPTRNSSAVNDRYRLVIPLRTTYPLDGSVILTICPDYATYLQHRHDQGCGPNAYSSLKNFEGVTGTLIEDFGDQSTVVSPPVQSNAQHYAKVVLIISNFQSDVAGGFEQHLVSYPMYTTPLPDGSVSNHVISHLHGPPGQEEAYVTQPVEWTMWAEVIEDFVPSLPAVNPQQSSQDLLALSNPEEWLKLGVLAFVLAVVFPQISIPLYIIGVGAFIIADVLSNGEVHVKVWEAVKGVALGTVCAGAMLAPAIGSAIGGVASRNAKGVIVGGKIGSGLQPLAGAACVALGLTEAGLMDDLLKLIVEIPRILQRAVEVVGQILASVLRIFTAAYDVLLPWILLFLYAMGMLLTVWLTRETALVVFAWLILLFLAMRSQPAVDVLRRGETFARMIPIPLWDNRMRKMGALRGTYYRDELYRAGGKGA